MYSAVVLDEHSQFRLQDRFLEFLRINDFQKRKLVQDWKFYCHHMTMNFGRVPTRDHDLSKIVEKGGEGKVVSLSVSQYGFFRDSVCAVKVTYNSLSEDLSSNNIPHITIGCGEKGKPAMSNQIFDWKMFRTMELSGRIKIINN